jgi:hypothetical protein
MLRRGDDHGDVTFQARAGHSRLEESNDINDRGEITPVERFTRRPWREQHFWLGLLAIIKKCARHLGVVVQTSSARICNQSPGITAAVDQPDLQEIFAELHDAD